MCYSDAADPLFLKVSEISDDIEDRTSVSIESTSWSIGAESSSSPFEFGSYSGMYSLKICLAV